MISIISDRKRRKTWEFNFEERYEEDMRVNVSRLNIHLNKKNYLSLKNLGDGGRGVKWLWGGKGLREGKEEGERESREGLGKRRKKREESG